MRNRFRWCAGAAACAALAVLHAGVAPAATVDAGIDVWHTPAGGASIDFGGINSSNPNDDEAALPAGFFCAGSPAISAYVEMGGAPIATSSPTGAVGDADTIVERLDPITLSNGQSGQIGLRIAALNLQQTGGNTITACNESWTVRAHLSDQASQTEGTMTVTKSTAHTGGTFTSSFTVKPRFEFEGNTSGTFKDLYPTSALTVSTASPGNWAPTFCPNAVEVASTFMADTTGDGTPDTWLPGTGNANFGCRCDDATCTTVTAVPVEHDGPHPDTHTDPIDIDLDCGAGPELAPLLPLLLWLRERRRRARRLAG